MADSIAKFHDAHIRPPRGGWTFAGITRYSETELVEAIAKLRSNNGGDADPDRIAAEIWAEFCGREPERCGILPGAVRAAAIVPREVTKELQGPPIWTFLNTVAVQWHEGMHPYFLATINAVLSILVCPICREEWRRLLRSFPPDGLNSKLAVCQWVNMVHNDVNIRNGGSEYPYARMVAEYGAPLA